MQNLFVSEADEFTVRFTVGIDKNGTIFCDLTNDSLIKSLESMGKDTKEFNIADYQATFKKPSFGDTLSMYNEIFRVGGDNGVSFNPILVRYKKISSIIKSWNLKGKEEKPTEEDISRLHPVIANAIGIQLDVEIGPLFM